MSGQHPPGHGGNPPNPYGNQNGPYGEGDGSQNPPYGQEPPGYTNAGQGGYNPGPGYSPYPGGGQPGGGQPGGGQPGAGQPGGSQLGGGGGSHLGGSQLSGGPSGPGGRNNLIIIAVAAGLAIILAVGAGFLLTRGGDEEMAGGPGDPGGDSSAESPAAQQGGKPSDPVQGYLDALAASDAEKAMSFAKTAPADKTLLTNEVLEASNERAPISEVSVPEVTDEYTSRVSASFKVGEQAVNQDFRVEQVGSEWKVTEIVTDLSLRNVRANSVPLMINGQEVNSDELKVFPGSYEFTTGLKYLDYGKSNILVVEGPDSSARTSDITLTLTKAGTDEFTKAAKAHHKACVAKKELNPKGCPNQANTEKKAKKGTVKWTVSGDPWAGFKPQISYEDPAAAEARLSSNYKVTFKDSKGEAWEGRGYGSGKYLADLTAEKMKVTFDG